MDGLRPRTAVATDRQLSRRGPRSHCKWVPAAHFSCAYGNALLLRRPWSEKISSSLKSAAAWATARPTSGSVGGSSSNWARSMRASEAVRCARRAAARGVGARLARAPPRREGTRGLYALTGLSALARPPILCALLVLQCGCVSAIDVLPLPSPGPGV